MQPFHMDPAITSQHLAFAADYLTQLVHLQTPVDLPAWHQRVLPAIRGNTDHAGAWRAFAIWLLTDAEWGALSLLGSAGLPLTEVVQNLQNGVGDGDPRADVVGYMQVAKASLMRAAAGDNETWRKSKAAWIAAACDKFISLLEAS